LAWRGRTSRARGTPEVAPQDLNEALSAQDVELQVKAAQLPVGVVPPRHEPGR